LPKQPPSWSVEARRAMDRAVAAGVSSEGLAVFARWWQLENWLRLLVYIELRASRGSQWVKALPRQGKGLTERDGENAYMSSPDSANPLAYLDAGELFTLIGSDDVWPLVEYALLKRRRWDGLVDELRSIRNRTAHLRRPHRDDLARIEQGLRNLEPGARKALESFNRRLWLPDNPADELAKAWVDGEHADARRLLRHAEQSYDTVLQITYSVRPWASDRLPAPISGQPGTLIHAGWFMRDGAGLQPRDFWGDEQLDATRTRDLIVLVEHASDAEISVSFSGADNSEAIANAIGTCFDLVLRHRKRVPTAGWRKRWLLDSVGLDARVQVNSALLVATEDQPFSVFGA
jgi:hypothetical protein